MGLYDIDIAGLGGDTDVLGSQRDKVTLAVNVASKCGLTPQYTGLERLQKKYEAQGFTVVGFPSNQFGGQEPGTSEEIATFCSTTYGVTFPLTEKIEVNGDNRHPVYEQLTATPDASGYTGDIRWNFEKFLIGRDGSILGRFAPQTEPESDEVVTAVESALKGS
jgi:glutathione peroxidase